MNRRTFLKTAGGGLGALTSARDWTLDASQGAARGAVRDVVVVGAGAFGGWTALYLQEMGVAVTLIDQYGAGIHVQFGRRDAPDTGRVRRS